MSRTKAVVFFYCLAALFLSRSWILGQTHYPADILAAYPLFYDGIHEVRNYDLMDVINIFYPQSLYYQHRLGLGELAVWDPYSFAGHNLLSNGHSGFFYPLRLFTHLVLPMPWCHDLFLWLHLGLAGVTFCLLLRSFGLSRRSALFGGAVYQFNGFAMGWFEHEHVLTYTAWLPLILYFYRAGFQQSSNGRRAAYWAAAALFLGGAGLVGMMQFWAYTLIIAAVWGLIHWVAGSPRLPWTAAALLPLSWAVAVGLGAVNVLPILSDLPLSGRHIIPWEYQTSSFRQVLTGLPLSLVLPDFAGNPVGGFHLQRVTLGGQWIFPETFFYVGLVPLALIPFSWHYRRRLEWKFFVFFPLAVILIGSTPLFAVIHAALPGFKQTIVTRFLFVLEMSLVTLSAFGLEYLGEKSDRWLKFRNLVAGAAALLCLLYTAMPQLKGEWFQAWLNSGRIRLPDPQITPNFPLVAQVKFQEFFSLGNPSFWLPLVVLSLAALGATLAARDRRWLYLPLLVAVVDPFYHGWIFNTASPPARLYPATPEVQFLQGKPGRVLSLASVRPNTLAVFKLRGLEGDESLYAEATRLYGCALARVPFQGPESFAAKIFPVRQFENRFLDLAGVRWLVAHPDRELETPLRNVFTAQLRIWENPTAGPECYWTNSSVAVPDDLQALQRIMAAPAGREGEVVLTTLDVSSEEKERVEKMPLAFDRPSPEKVVVPGPLRQGWVVFAEGYNPGWQAVQDGRALPVVRANGMFMAVKVENGGELRLRFEARGLRLGAGISVLSLLLLVGTMMLGWRRSGEESFA